MSSLQTRNSHDESIKNNNTNARTSNNSSDSNQNETSQSEFITNNNSTNESTSTQINISETSDTNTKLPQPVITKSSMVKILDEIPPPPYSTVSMPIPSHSRDHTFITINSLPEYQASNSSLSTITTQPQVTPHPSRNHDLSNDVLLSSKLCKICQESEDDQGDAKLISPCKCKGSLQYVHIGCLNRWRYSDVREDASYRCEVCKYEYKFYRPRIAKIFSSSITLHFFTLVLLLSSIYLFSYLVKLLDSHEHNVPGKDPNPPSKLPNRWRDIQFLNLRLIHFIYGTAIISIFGLIFFMFMICFNGFRRTRNDYCYCGGFGHPFCLGGTGGMDCVGTDGDCGIILILIILVILAIIFMFGFVGAVIAAYLFTQKIISVCLEKVHDRILEVKKDD